MVRINTFIVIRCLNTIVSATSIIACMRDRKKERKSEGILGRKRDRKRVYL